MWVHARRKQRGQMVVVVAILFVPLIALLALGVDAGRAFVDARAVQNAADEAALAGAQDIDRATNGIGSYSPSKARMDAMVFVARQLGLMNQLANVTCSGASLTPDYFAVPVSYSADIDSANCNPSTSRGVQLGAYQVSIYQPPSADSANAGNAYAIEVQVTHNVPTTLASVVGFTQLPVYQRAVAGTTSGRWTLMMLKHYATNNQSDITLNAATLDVINGDIGDNSGLSTTSNGITPAIVNWWYCNPRQYGGGDPATDQACQLTSSESLYKWQAASASFNQDYNNPVYDLHSYLQDPGYAAPTSVINTETTPDCVFQSGPEAKYYKNGLLTVPNQSVFHIPPGAYGEIKVTSSFSGTIVLDSAPTPIGSCPISSNNNTDKTPGFFILGSAGQNKSAIDLQSGVMVGNGVFLYVMSPGSAANSNQITVHSGAQFYLDGRSDIFGYVGTASAPAPYCVTSQVPPTSYHSWCQLAVPSPWGTAGTLNGVAQGDPISIMLAYASGATASNPGAGSGVISFNSGSASDVQGLLYAPDDNVTLAGGALGSGAGRVIALTATYSSNNGKVIEEFASSSPSVFGLLE
jgi:putative Flp pilus-assembly TadE/G-like protein